MKNTTLALDMGMGVKEQEGFKQHNLILQNIWMLYIECTQMIYLCQVIKSNLKTIYTLILPSQGRACAMQQFHLNYSVKNLGWILIMLKVNSAKTSNQFRFLFFMARNSLHTSLWNCRLQIAQVCLRSRRVQGETPPVTCF